jgi:hypothetical protein
MTDFIGHKGGSEHVHYEAPDSLHSTSYARVLDLISEGEILGLSHGLRSVLLNGTPLENADGTKNFNNVTVDYRSGTQAQDFIAGFPAVENEIGVGVELRAVTPWVHTITNLTLSAIRITLGVPALSKSDTTNGDIGGYKIDYVIELSIDGGAYATVVTASFNGKTTTQYQRSTRIDLPTATTGWAVRVRRITANADTATIADTTTVVSYTDVIDAKLRYPMSALVGIQVDAKQFQQIPTRSYDMYGRIIQVPTNYDPVARTYAGVWDGTFKPAWTSNPAWIFRDLVLNERYGLGKRISTSQIDKWALYAISRYCDELVPDGKGGTEPRFTCNLYLQTQKQAYAVLQDIASVFRGISYWGGGSIMPSADIPSDPVYVYTAANVVDGKFSRVGSSKKTRFTVTLVSWNDPSDSYKAKVEYVEDQEGVKRYGIQQINMTAFGCTSQGQAQRAGRWALTTSRLETGMISFDVGMDGAIVMPGQIVRVADPSRMGRRVGGRVHSASGRVVTLDKAPTISAGDKLTVILPTGISETHNVVSISADSVTVDADWTTLPIAQSIWSVDSNTLAAPTYKIMSIVEKVGGATFTITATQHEPGKYAFVENGTAISTRPQTSIDVSTQAAPVSVSISSYLVALNEGQKLAISVSCAAVVGAIAYEGAYKCDSGNWIPIPRQSSPTADIVDVIPGTYAAKLSAVNSVGVTSVETVSADTVVTLPANPRTIAISDDPFILNAAGAWDLTNAPGVVVGTGTTAAGAVCSNYFSAPTFAGSTNAVPSSKRAFPIDPSRVYNLSAMLFAATGNNRTMYILVQFFNAAGSALPHTDSTPDWGGTYSGYVYGNTPPTGVFSRQGGFFGPNTGRNIPAAARTARIGVIMQYSGAGSSSVEQAFQDLRLYDATDAYVANTAAATAQAAAAAAQTDATASLASLTAIFADGVLSRDEKQALIVEFSAANSEYALITAQATSLGVTYSAYTAALSAWSTYLGGLSPAWNDTTQNTNITRTTANTKATDYYDAKVGLTNAIAAKTARTATDVTLSPLGVLSGGGTSGQIIALATVDLGDGTSAGMRQCNDPPSFYPVGTTKQFKQATTIGLTSPDAYVTLETIKQYGNSTGGGIYQYAYIQLTTWRRWCIDPANTSSSAWGAWTQDLDRNVYTGDLNATVGATAGTNLKDSSGTVMGDARVSNGYTENGIGHVMRPLGGNATSGTGTVGALQILLPTAGFNSLTMLRIRIEIYEYQTGRSCSYIVNGYNYPTGPQWYNVTAEYNGPVAGRKRVRFGQNTAGTRNAIWIGELASTWEYPRVMISEVITSYTNYDWSTWASGWALSFVTSFGGTWSNQVDAPSIGAAMASIDGITVANAPTFVATGAITDTMIGGNLYSTNWNSTVGPTGTGWALDRTGNLYANSAQLRGATMGGSFTGFGWPAAGLTGYYLGASGLLLGNYNDGKYFEVNANGDVYAPGFNIVSGVATFAGALSGATGTFAGALSAATGSFAGSLSAATGSFAGSLSAATGSFAGSLSAATGSFAGSLSAVTGTFGAVTIASGGSISSGQTAYNTGTGWWWGSVSGTPKFSIGSGSGNRMTWDGTTLSYEGQVALPAFTVAITGTLDTSKSNSLIAGTSIGTLTATATGGRGTLVYSWVALSGETNPTSRTGLVYLSAPTNNVTGVSAKISNTDSSIIGTYIVNVTDADGRVATARTTSMVAFGTPP